MTVEITKAFVVQAALRLQAQPILPTRILDSEGKATCKLFTRNLKHYHTDDLGTNNGLTVMHVKDKVVASYAVFILVNEDSEVVAYLECNHADTTEFPSFRHYFVASYVYVMPDYRKRNVAMLLHLAALHTFKHLISDTKLTPGSMLVWRKLPKYGYHVKMWSVEDEREVSFKWEGDEPHIEGIGAFTATPKEFIFYA